MANESTKWLYEQLKSQGYNVGKDLGEFEGLMKSNAQSRQWAFETARKEGLNVGKDINEFTSLVAPVAKTAPQEKSAPQEKTAPRETAKSQTQTQTQVQTTTSAFGPFGKHNAQQPTTVTQPKQSSTQAQTAPAQPKEQPKQPARTIQRPATSAPARSATPQATVQNTQQPKLGAVKPWDVSGASSGASVFDPYGKRNATSATVAQPAKQPSLKSAVSSARGGVPVQGKAEDYVINNIINNIWKEAEAQTKKDVDKVYNDEMAQYAAFGGGKENRTVAAAGMSQGREVAMLRNFDFEKMAQKAVDILNTKTSPGVGPTLPQTEEEKRQQVSVFDPYGKQKSEPSAQPQQPSLKRAIGAAHGELLVQGETDTGDNPTQPQTEEEKRQQEALFRKVYQKVYDYAVAKNAPQSTVEFFLRKVMDMNVISSISKGLSRSASGASDELMKAEEQAMGEYSKDHKIANAVGTGVGILVDPITLASSAVGGVAMKGAVAVGGKIIAPKVAAPIASRLFMSTTAGKATSALAASIGNMATFETLKEAETQFKHGGRVNPETGETEGYSAMELLKAAGHGSVLGLAMGGGGLFLGNVADKAVKATSSTAGKVGVRGAEIGASTLFNGTIFAADGYRQTGEFDLLDGVMTDFIGFKGVHAVKTAPSRIASLRPIKNPQTMAERNHNRMSFEEHLRRMANSNEAENNAYLDNLRRNIQNNNGNVFSEHDREILKKYGYGDLAKVFEKNAKTKIATAEGVDDGVERVEAEGMYVGSEFDGYGELERLTQDARVPETIRATAYYIFTGKAVPTSTVMGYREERNDTDGTVTIDSVNANGAVVTSRRFANETQAQEERNTIMRQVELNTIQMGERYADYAVKLAVMEDVKEAVAKKWKLPVEAIENIYSDYFAGKSLPEAEMQIVNDVHAFGEGLESKHEDLTTAGIKEYVQSTSGVDLETAIRKEPSKRSDVERDAVEEYADRLHNDAARYQKAKRVWADQVEERKAEYAEELREAWRRQIEGRLLTGKVYEGTPEEREQAKVDIDAINLRAQEARKMCEDAFGDDAEYWLGLIDENPWDVVDNPTLSDSQRDAVLYYINSKAAQDGVQSATVDAVESRRAEVESNIRRRTHQERGNIQPATMKVDDRQVYIVKGDVVMFPDGTAVDHNKSSESVIVCDAETGEYKFVSPTDIFRVDPEIDPQAELDAAFAQIDAEFGSATQPTDDTEADAEQPATDPEAQQTAGPTGGRWYIDAYNSALEEAKNLSDEDILKNIQQLGAQSDILTDGGRGVLDAYIAEYDRRMSASAESVPNTTENAVSEAESVPNAENSVENGQKEPALSRIPVDRRSKEPLFEQAPDHETAWDGLVEAAGGNPDIAAEVANAQIEAITAELRKLTSKPPKVSGTPMQMLAQKKEHQDKIDALQARLDTWNGILGVNTARIEQDKARVAEERRAENARLQQEAQARFEEEQRVKAEKEAEQAAVGTHAVNPKIKEKWDNANKIEGANDAMTLPDGSTLRGRYVLAEAGSATASHDINNAFAPTEGFPVDVNGQSVNDRDYQRDTDAQRIVQSIADSYDNRALQTPVVVSRDGVVLSGNNRTMSGDLAARQGTDKAYVDYLREFAGKYGFTQEQIDGMQNPRVVFVPNEELPYDATTFARFNAQEMKSQSKSEAAVKLGKTVPDDVFSGIVAEISKYDRLSDYYTNERAVAQALGALKDAGVINENQMPEYRTGTAVSAAGRELIENTLIGKVFEKSGDAVRQIIGNGTMKEATVMSLTEIASNRTLGNGYDLSDELAKAVDLVARAKAAHPDLYKEGVPVSPFGRQAGLFDDEFGESSVTDGVVLMLADALNSGKPSDLRKMLAAYNREAGDAAIGQMNIESMGVPSKEEVMSLVKNTFGNATRKEQQAIVNDAIADRKRRAELEAQQRAGAEATGQALDAGQGQGAGVEANEQTVSTNNAPGVAGQGGVESSSYADFDAELSVGRTKGTLKTVKDGVATYVDNESGEPVIILSASSEDTYCGLYRKPGTNRWSAKMENAGSKDAWRGIMARAMAELPQGAELYERSSVSLDGLRVLAQQLSHGFESSGKTFQAELNAADKGGVFGKQMQNDNPFNGISWDGDVEALRDILEPYLDALGMGREAVSVRGDGKVKITLPTLIKTGHEGKAEPIRIELPKQEAQPRQKKSFDLSHDSFTREDLGQIMFDEANSSNSEKEFFDKMSRHIKVSGYEADLRDFYKGVKDGHVDNARRASFYATGYERVSNQPVAEPTDAQKEAGNYKKEHVRVDGHNISIENKRGSVRRGTDSNGNAWENEMKHDYGYIRGTEGVDGDHIDVYLSENPEQGDVFVVDQVNEDGSFDEHKVMYGFGSEQEARDAYLSNYEDGWQGLGGITHVSKEEFKKWIQSSKRKTKPFAEYKHIKNITEDVDQTPTNVNDEGVVVDGDGNTMVLYHGTPNNVGSLGDLRSGFTREGVDAPARFNGDGISFTPDKTVAEEYADGGKVFEANVTLKKPYYTVGVAHFEPEEAQEFTKSLIEQGYDGIINYASKWARESGAAPNEVVVFDINSARDAAPNAGIAQYNDDAYQAGAKQLGDIIGVDKAFTELDRVERAVKRMPKLGDVVGVQAKDENGFVYVAYALEHGNVLQVINRANNDYVARIYDENGRVVDRLFDVGVDTKEQMDRLMDGAKANGGFFSDEHAEDMFMENAGRQLAPSNQSTVETQEYSNAYLDEESGRTLYDTTQAKNKEEFMMGLRSEYAVSNIPNEYKGKMINLAQRVLGSGTTERTEKRGACSEVSVSQKTQRGDKEFLKELYNVITGETDESGHNSLSYSGKPLPSVYSESVLDEDAGCLYEITYRRAKQVGKPDMIWVTKSSYIGDGTGGSKSAGATYSITPTTYTNKKGKTSDVHLVKFNRELTREEKAALDSYAREPLADGKKTSRGWYDRKEGGYMMRSEEAARELGEMIADETGEAIADAQPLSKEELREAVRPKAETKPKTPKKPANRANIEDVIAEPVEQPKVEAKPKKEGSKIVINDNMKDIANILSDALGIDDTEMSEDVFLREGTNKLTPAQRKVVIAAGTDYVIECFEQGVSKFEDFANAIIQHLGPKIKPWVKVFYQGAKLTPGYEHLEFTSDEDVRNFDVDAIGKPSAEAIDKARQVLAEQEAKKVAEQAEKELKEERNQKRKERDEQTTADTVAIAEEAGTVAGKARSAAKTSKDTVELQKHSEEIDRSLDDIADQLALLGFYEAEKYVNDYNEAYGYMRNAEKKAVKDAARLVRQLIADLGIDVAKVHEYGTTAKSIKRDGAVVRANIVPAGGEVNISLPLNDSQLLNIQVGMKPQEADNQWGHNDNLEVTHIMYRVDKLGGGGRGVQRFADKTIKYGELRDAIAKEIGVNVKSDESSLSLRERVREWLDSRELVKGWNFPFAGDSIAKEFGIPKDEARALFRELKEEWKAQRDAEMQKLADMAERGESPYTVTPEVEAELAKQKEDGVKSINGYKVGDEVMFDRSGKGKWEKYKISDFSSDGRPVLDSFGVSFISEIADWERIKPANGVFGEAERVANKEQEKREIPIKELSDLCEQNSMFKSSCIGNPDREAVSRQIADLIIPRILSGLRTSDIELYHRIFSDKVLKQHVGKKIHDELMSRYDKSNQKEDKPKYAVGDHVGVKGQECEVIKVHSNGYMDLKAPPVAGINRTMLGVAPDEVYTPGSEDAIRYWYGAHAERLIKQGIMKLDNVKLEALLEEAVKLINKEKQNINNGRNGFGDLERMAQAIAMELVVRDRMDGKMLVYRSAELLIDDTKKPSPSKTASDTPSSKPDLTPILDALRSGKPAKKPKNPVKADEELGGLFGGVEENSLTLDGNNSKNENNETERASNSGSKGVAEKQRTHSVGDDAPGVDGGMQPREVRESDRDGESSRNDSSLGSRTDEPAHGAGEDGGLQPLVGDRGRDEGVSPRGSKGAGTKRGGTTGQGIVRGSSDAGGEDVSERGSAAVSGGGGRSTSVKVDNSINFHYGEDGNAADNYTKSERLEANIRAIETLCNVLEEKRTPTDEERITLSRFRGWGQVELSHISNLKSLMGYYEGSQLRRIGEVLTKIDPTGERGILDAIKHASLTAFHTPAKIVQAQHHFLTLAGFKGGRFLDPSLGIGAYEGNLPKELVRNTMITGVELDWLSGQIAKMLYPAANIHVTGFENANIAPGSYDVVSSNVPFGKFEVYDKSWRNNSNPVLRLAQQAIHNYYAVKMLESLRPGGLMSMMTSTSVMDTKGNQPIRKYITDNGEFIGAVRLPDNTFQGTGAMCDIIFVRKWRDAQDMLETRTNPDYVKLESAFLSSASAQAPGKRDGVMREIEHNGYYQMYPDNLVGKTQSGNQYSDRGFGLTSGYSVDEISSKVKDAIERIVGDRKGKLFNTTKSVRQIHEAVRETYRGDGDWVGNGNLVVQGGKVGTLVITKNEYGDTTHTFEEAAGLQKDKAKVEAIHPLRKALKQLISAQITGENENTLSKLRAELRKEYDSFVNRYGRLNDNANKFILEDIDGYTIRGLEDWKNGKFAGLKDIFEKNTIKPALMLDTAKTPQEALSMSLAEYGELRPEYLRDALGEEWAEMCGDLIFRDPMNEGEVLMRDDYLSGDVVTKLEQAIEAAKEDASFEKNVKELEAVQPERIGIDDITAHLGARWIPIDIINDFVRETFGIKSRPRNNEWVNGKLVEHFNSGVAYIPETDTYMVELDSKELGGDAKEWETDDKSAKAILQAALEDRSIKVTRKDANGNTYTDEGATELAKSKVEALRDRFDQWLPLDDSRVSVIEDTYNSKFNRTVKRKWDGSHLMTPGLMDKELRPHQKDAVWMLINNRGGIVDHIVGAGKTLVMQSAIMEMRRMGIAKKPIIVALKSTVPQIAREFKEAYPAARILAPRDNDFSKQNRKKFFANIALNDYDCVIMSHEQYGMIPHSEEADTRIINEQLAQLDATLSYLYGTNDKSAMTKKQIKGLEKRKANLIAQMMRNLDRNTDREFCFENLGIDYMFVDESHQFKSAPYTTSFQNIAGLQDPKGSERAVALMTGIRSLQNMHQGDKGVIFLSGTTITNSLVEIYNLLNYLRPNKMKELGITSFDAWASIFSSHTTEIEASHTGEFKEKDRFRNFDNVRELSQLYSEIADVRNDLNLKLPKPEVVSTTHIIPSSGKMAEINREIVRMLERKDGSYFGIKPENPEKHPWALAACRISAKAAISPRLVFPDSDEDGGKIKVVCENVKKAYDEFNEQKGVQLIFCELGVPSKANKGYDAYNDIINRLVNQYGIPRKEIAYIQQANNDKKKEALFQNVRDGKIRILIGGTKNMGTGVNVQDLVTDSHFLSVPWTPSALEQCIGRSARQGNKIAPGHMDNKVRVHYYASEGTLDLYKYQLLDAKSKMLTQFKIGAVDGAERSFDEGSSGEDSFDPAEVVAILSGNPVIFEKSKQDKIVKKLKLLYNAWLRNQRRLQTEYIDLSSKTATLEQESSQNDRDVERLQAQGFVADEDGKYPLLYTVSNYPYSNSGMEFDKAKEGGEYILNQLKKGRAVYISGFGVTAKVEQVHEETGGLFSSYYLLKAENYVNPKYSVRLSEDAVHAGTDFRSLLQTIIRAGELRRSRLEDNKRKLATMSKGDGEFPKQKELDEAIARKDELDAEYNLLKKANSSADVNDIEGIPGDAMLRTLMGDEIDYQRLQAMGPDEIVVVTRNMQVLPGKMDLASPMAGIDHETKQYRIMDPKAWNGSYASIQLTDEQVKMYDQLEKVGHIIVNGKTEYHFDIAPGLRFQRKEGKVGLYYNLRKNTTGKKGQDWVAYNPYDHAKFNTLNLQFASAYKRPNMIMVEAIMPKSELMKVMAQNEVAEGAYHSPYAKNSVGIVDWGNGEWLALSRWSKIIRVLPNREVAERINAEWKKRPEKSPKNSIMAYNPKRYTPQVLKYLKEMGWEFDPEIEAELNARTPEEIEASYDKMPYLEEEDIDKLNERYADSEYESMFGYDPSNFLEERIRAHELDLMADAATGIAERLGGGSKITIYRTREEARAAGLPEYEVRSLGGYRVDGSDEMFIILENHRDAQDVADTFIHEDGHAGIRLLFPTNELYDNAMDEMYSVSSKKIQAEIDAETDMYVQREADRLMRDEDFDKVYQQAVEEHGYAPKEAYAHAEAGKKKAEYRRRATDEYGSRVAQKVGEKGFEKMTKEEQTFWGKLKALLDQALDNLLRGLKIPKMRSWTDKQWARVYYEGWKMRRQRGQRTMVDIAENAARYADNPHPERETMYRSGDDILAKRPVLARAMYEQRVATSSYQVREAMQDSMLGLLEAYNAIEKASGRKRNIEDIAGPENAYIWENRLSSKNREEQKVYQRLVIKPMLDEVAKLAPNDVKYEELTRYMMAKHGIERNIFMRNKAIADGMDPAVADEKDFAGLTGLAREIVGVAVDTPTAEAWAQQFVANYESANKTDELWRTVKAATKATLSKLKEGGLLSEDTHDKIADMYENYIPLRGWAETTADEVYGYLSRNDGAVRGNVMKKANGRTSIADDPIATIAMMGEQAISQSNRNKMKQAFFNYVRRNPSDLVSVNRLWLKYDDTSDEWLPAIPDGQREILESDDADTVARKWEEHERWMDALAQVDPNNYKRGRQARGIPYKIGNGVLSEHTVLVRVGDDTYIMTINGNPRAAQALNGLSNPDVGAGLGAALFGIGEKINHLIAPAYTTRNPDFMVGNFLRDAIYTNTMTWVKESSEYAKKFNYNFFTINPIGIGKLVTLHNADKLDMNDELHRHFRDFMLNGGETGYTNLQDIEKHKKRVKKMIKRANGKLTFSKMLDILGEKWDMLNSSAENCARFSAYLTSRQMGRSIDRSIYDAKEVSVNFNKKGAGATFMGSTGQTVAGNTAAFMSGTGRGLYVFWNAVVQASTNFFRNAKRHPGKLGAGMGVMFALGIAQAILGAIDDARNDSEDDTNNYFNQPDFVRRSNFLIKAGNARLKLPLPHEYLTVFGMGELAATLMMGKEEMSSWEIASEIAGLLSEFLPVKMEGAGPKHSFIPSSVKPVVEANINESWTGLPIYKDNPFNERMPEWTKAYKSSNKQLKNLAEALNRWTGGNDYLKGKIDINPAKIEYALNGYLGGYFKMWDRTMKLTETALGDREFEWRNIPLANRVVQQGDERTAGRSVNNDFYEFSNEYEDVRRLIRSYEAESDKGLMEYAERLAELSQTPEFRRYWIMDGYQRDLRAIKADMKEAETEEEYEALEKEQFKLRKEIVQKLKGERPVETFDTTGIQNAQRYYRSIKR